MFTFVKCYAISNEATACCQIRTRDIHRLRLKQWLVLGWSLILSFSLPNLHLLSVSLFSIWKTKREEERKQKGKMVLGKFREIIRRNILLRTNFFRIRKDRGGNRISRPGFFFFFYQATKLPYKHLLLINRILFHQG